MAEQPVSIIQGSCMDVLPTLDAGSVNCVVTSPPYWGLRDYGVEGQLGLEPTPEQYVENLVAVFREVRRALRDDGTAWLNLGDSYAGGKQGNDSFGDPSSGLNNGRTGVGNKTGERQRTAVRKPPAGLKPKDLVGIPWRVAFALQADGWWLRSDIIWSKPNPMPESVRDRPTRAHEYVFLLSKSAKYFYDAAAIRETPARDWFNETRTEPGNPDRNDGGAVTSRPRATDKQRGHGRRHAGFNDRWDGMTKEEQQALGANKRSVWEIATQPFPGAHFATFPEALVKPCILAGCPEKCCAECGAPWVRVTEERKSWREGAHDNWDQPSLQKRTLRPSSGGMTRSEYATVGERSTCEHQGATIQGTVLDPFAGSGTVGVVARKAGRKAVLIELSADYCEMMRGRMAQAVLL